MAAMNHYIVMGIDADLAILKAARSLAKWQGSSARFEEGNLTSSSKRRAKVISAASLLAVLADRIDALEILWSCVQSGGHLLIIEPTGRMNPYYVNKMMKSEPPKKRLSALKLWAKARENRAVNPNLFAVIDAEDRSSLKLLDGRVKTCIFERNSTG